MRSLPCAAIAALLLGAGVSPVVAQAAAMPDPCTATYTPVTLTATLPTFFSAVAKSQTGANCIAWQEFIYLNWQADPGNPGVPNPNATPASFGTSGDTTATVWESYLAASQVFNPPGNVKVTWTAPRPAIKQLSRLSKLGDADLTLHAIGQAGDNKWITDQRGGLAFYEIRINQDEVAYITQNVFDLTTAAGQLSCAQAKGGLSLPAGNRQGHQDTDCNGNPQTYGLNNGTLEIKAAWVALPSDGSLNYRYKIATAQLTQPDGSVTSATVGLVGLHIIHKVPGADQFLWATFEQIDNSPDDNNGNPAAPVLPKNPNQQPYGLFTFFNASCNPANDPYYKCQPNTLPGDPCPPGGSTPAGCVPYSAPMQITRLTPVDAQANNVTAYAWSLMPSDSVFNYYRLINVQWPNQPTPVPPGSTVPLTRGDITPAQPYVANTTLETYMQATKACMDCHENAPIAQLSQQSVAEVAGRRVRRVHIQPAAKTANGSASYGSDYSFIFAVETVR
jgi:hypothetical protein